MARAIPCYDHNGNQFSSLSKMCNYYKINCTTFRDRQKSGLSLEECLTLSEIPRKKEFNVGDTRINNQGLLMTIIKIHDGNEGLIDVQFEDGYIRQKAHMSEFKNGTIRDHMIPAIYGVGILGDVKTKVNGKITKEYSTWSNILQRCYSPIKHKEFPRYKDCSICDEWLYYPNFVEWCHSQSNWNKVIENPSEFHIDKDIICKRNKMYSPENCSFVPAYVNVMFVKGDALRNDLPIGVTRESFNKNRYRVRCKDSTTGKMITVGGFLNVEEAFCCYKEIKENSIKFVAQMEYEKGTITQKCYEAMMNYQVEITD